MGKYSKDKRDIYYRKAKELGFRARSAFKLLQIDEEFNILSGVKRAVDLCAAPGSWSQVLSRKLYKNKNNDDDDIRIVAVDLQAMAPIAGVIQIQGDITSVATSNAIISSFDGLKADLVICDGAPDVTGMHDIDEYIQSQLILSALNITTFLLKKNGNFICKIFRGRDINLLYTKLEIFFNNISVAKPKSSRNSSCESFIVCCGYNPPNDYIPNMNILKFNNNNNNHKYNHLRTIKFVACGDLDEYDSDANYPLVAPDNNKNDKYKFIQPPQPPINPNYKEFIEMKKNQVFSNTQSYNDNSDLDDGDDVILSIDNVKYNKNDKKENKYNDDDDDDINYSEIENEIDVNYSVRGRKHSDLIENELDNLSVSSLSLSPKKIAELKKSNKRNQKKMRTKKNKSIRKSNRNKIAVYTTIIVTAGVLLYLAKFYYQTHQINNDNNSNNNSNSSIKDSKSPIDFRVTKK